MIEIVAVGAIRAIAFTLRAESSMFSTLTMSFHPSFPERTWRATLTVESLSREATPMIRSTSRARPFPMWSMTVPFLIGVIFSSRIDPHPRFFAFGLPSNASRSAMRTGTARNACRK